MASLSLWSHANAPATRPRSEHTGRQGSWNFSSSYIDSCEVGMTVSDKGFTENGTWVINWVWGHDFFKSRPKAWNKTLYPIQRRKKLVAQSRDLTDPPLPVLCCPPVPEPHKSTAIVKPARERLLRAGRGAQGSPYLSQLTGPAAARTNQP